MPQGICYCSECGGEMELVGETPFDNDSSASSYSPDSCDTTATVDHSLISNASLGAKKTFIKNDEIPSSILNRIRKIDHHFKHYGPRVYSADFAMDENNKPWLIELNSKPGMMYYDKAPHLREKYFNKLYQSFNKLL